MFEKRIFVTVAAAALFVAGTAGFVLFEVKKTAQNTNAAAFQTERVSQFDPNAGWEPLFFKALDERTNKLNLPSLKTMTLPDHDLEVRFWYDGRPQVINGFIIRRRGDQWSAFGIRQTNESEPSQVRQDALSIPKSGWEVAWQRLVNAGILTLPDGWSNRKCHSGTLDGGGYVVETNVNKAYRTYKYGNPQLAKCDEARQILLIEKIIAEEFGPQGI